MAFMDAMKDISWAKRCTLTVLLACGCGAPPAEAPNAPSPSVPVLTPPPLIPQVRPLTAADRQKSAGIIENAIRVNLRKPTGPLAAADRQRITELYLTEQDIADLSPLADLPQLQVLNLRGNRITDLRPLARLAHLEKLGLDGNQVTDLTPLRGLKMLKVLDLVENPHLPPMQVHRLRQALPGCRVLFSDN